jgi:hypothetical protein
MRAIGQILVGVNKTLGTRIFGTFAEQALGPYNYLECRVNTRELLLGYLLPSMC